jgi:hypothetical protein
LRLDAVDRESVSVSETLSAAKKGKTFTYNTNIKKNKRKITGLRYRPTLPTARLPQGAGEIATTVRG